ncbi:bifunctional 2-polyprenyl-6-hydroxyphenol methylase/3-demethylubiquinol 3-O-methyltransferase UbiG [Hydromonas duriensis]|uniref:Ubiquinone biosynthesis O-methyltransferase n=1 Tax=Hydromonas duriensis TaxID=1527608 RepID=A0A4R6Y659_9BURK|nr:bifunctional 2-polyprenyl-6-hydroxyphenol methylase/3-demethylubiquinol 3-O-methyltransferase UbiG [Hydromonas duriensis]TDR30806.1 3-demethylubiquinone-9 3-methyltransferase [Hydromonas duriensis]
MPLNQNITPAEIEKFSQHAQQWWDENGPLKTLHQVNPVRLAWISEHINLQQARVIDVGCGGGILTEALARAGAHATGLDMAADSIEIAKLHALAHHLPITYHVNTAEQMAEEAAHTFDAVTCMEMLEHVPDPASVIQACAKMVKTGGTVFFSTLNRHPKALALGIVAAEYLLNWIPKGTHQYKTFIKPSELAQYARLAGLEVIDVRGIAYHPWRDKQAPFVTTHDTDVNYMMACRKN